MNVNDVIRRVQRTFGDENEAQIRQQDVIDWINAAQLRMARETKCLQTEVDIPINATANGYPLPVDFLSDDQVTYSGLNIRRTNMKYLQEVLGETNLLGTSGTGEPATMYYIYAKKIWLYPWPKVVSATNLHLYYSRVPVVIDTSDDLLELPVNMHEDIVTYCMVEANKSNADYEEARRTNADLNLQIAASREESGNPDSDSYASVRNYEGDLW